MENKYKLIINLNATTKKVYEQYFTNEGYQILINDDTLIFAKQVNNPHQTFKNELEIINYIVNTVKRQRPNGILYINLDQEINSILNKVGNADKVDFKANFISWPIRQAILKSMLIKSKEKN